MRIKLFGNSFEVMGTKKYIGKLHESRRDGYKHAFSSFTEADKIMYGSHNILSGTKLYGKLVMYGDYSLIVNNIISNEGNDEPAVYIG